MTDFLFFHFLIINFSSSSFQQYSCWEEKRKNDFFQIVVQTVGDKKDGKVKVVDVEALAGYAAEDRPEGDTKPQISTAPPTGNNMDEEDGGEDEEDEDEEEDDGEEEE